jgi:uncharacterized membrane protein
MSKRRNGVRECSLCKKSKHGGEFAVGQTIRQPVTLEIQRVDPDWTPDLPICFGCLNRFRAEHVRQLLKDEKGELTALEEQVVDSLREQESISGNVYEEFEHQLTLADRLSDRLATFGGSWTFLIVFSTVVIGWMIINTVLLAQRPFDPFPFILLNLLLSCLAAIQAPVILMSQNRQDAKDRLRSEHDYRVNLKAELEVRLLHTKMDQLLTHQWERLLEIQELQMELMEDVANRARGGGK